MCGLEKENGGSLKRERRRIKTHRKYVLQCFFRVILSGRKERD
jgi:hypothetical protein